VRRDFVAESRMIVSKPISFLFQGFILHGSPGLGPDLTTLVGMIAPVPLPAARACCRMGQPTSPARTAVTQMRRERPILRLRSEAG
jgi:hypothetical protein